MTRFCFLPLVSLAVGVCLTWQMLHPTTCKAEDRPPDATQFRGTASKAVEFARDIYPVLQRACFECHGPAKQAGGLRLDRRSDAFDSGMIVAGDPAASELVRRLELPRGHQEVMPAIGDPLRPPQIEIIRQWIAGGAEWPDTLQPPTHWSYVVPVRPPLPQVSNEAWIRSPLDRFVLHRLDEEGLKPSPIAEPAKRLRRVFLDLIGLPPTPAEVDAFVAQPTTEHWESLVDELLERPQFGQRWARPWLDLARYADSHGFQRDDLRDNWAYRDWVIDALNTDMPFDQFTIEQLAGDLLPGASESQKIATGFHRCAPTNVEAGSLPEETRVEQVLDRVNTTGAIWLGSTLECCQCHDHKYDPFTLKEYYQLFAFFNNTALEADLTKPSSPSSIQFQGPTLALKDDQRDQERSRVQSQLDRIEQQLQRRHGELEAQLSQWAQQVSSRASQAAQLRPLEISHFSSQGTTDTYEKLADGSLLVLGGDPPSRDVYRLRATVDCANVSGFRLDVLPHESLPGGGPGRGDVQRRNFVLNDFSAEWTLTDTRPLRFVAAEAGFSQKGWDVAGAIDDDPKSGWAISPKFDQAHWATFVLESPIDLKRSAEVRFTLTQSFGQARTIGCFRLSAITGNPHLEPIATELLEVAAKPPEQWNEQERKKLLQAFAAEDSESSELTQRVTKLKQQLDDLAPDTTLVMQELPQPRMSTLFVRGDYKTPGESVTPGTPAALHPLAQDLRTEELTGGVANRLALARWLVSPTNPLVARATVNRWWAEVFGQGIVTTAEDLGLKGEPPSHSQLLDWLAVELMDNGWSMKRLLKTIVLSATYQQSSRITPELSAVDDQNRLLARGPRIRMDAEMIRDNALSIAGLLDLKPAGPPIRAYQPDGIWTKVGGQAYDYRVSPGSEQYRRGIYVVLKRGAPYPSFVNFDATARLACTVRRSRTNTPLQALTLLNDPVYVAAAMALAERILVERSSWPLEAKVDYAFQLSVARRPTPLERATLMDLFEVQMAAELAQQPQLDRSAAEHLAWQSVAAALLNLHETITKD